MMKKDQVRRALFSFAFAGLLVALFFLLRNARQPDLDGVERQGSGQQAAGDPRPTLPKATPSGEPTTLIPGEDGENGDPGAVLEQAKNDYLAYAVFPPWSRPYDESVAHIVKWNAPTSLGQAFALTADEEPISADVSLDKFFAGPGEALTVKVRVWQGKYEDKQGAPVAFSAAGDVTISGSMPTDVGGSASVHALTFSRQSGDSEFEQSATFVPSKIEALANKQHDASIWVWVTAGDRKFPFQVTFRYTSEKTTPLVVKGYIGDRIEDGSLAVDIEADVKVVSRILVRGGLYGAKSGEPIAVFDGWHEPTKLGLQPIRLTFFGKILRDKDIDGPYEVRNLSGLAQFDDGELLLDSGWSSSAVFETSSYKALQFSDQEWASPEKHEKIRLYEREIGRLRHHDEAP